MAQNMAPSRGEPCLLISTAVAAAAQRFALSSSFYNILQTRKNMQTVMHIQSYAKHFRGIYQPAPRIPRCECMPCTMQQLGLIRLRVKGCVSCWAAHLPTACRPGWKPA